MRMPPPNPQANRLVLFMLVVMTMVLVAAVPGRAVAATRAKPTVETATSGQTTATLTYTVSNFTNAKNVHLTITRAGATVYDGTVNDPNCAFPYCVPEPLSRNEDGPALRVSDLDGDGEAEVVVPLFSDGAHCCTDVLTYRYVSGAYVLTIFSAGNSFPALRDANNDGKLDLDTDDDAFAYTFASYAGSLRPELLLDFQSSDGTWVDTTRSYPKLIAANARYEWKLARTQCRIKDAETSGVYPAWAADEYRLNNRAGALKILRKQATLGCLSAAHGSHYRKPATYIKVLDHFLLASPYYKPVG